MFSFSVSETDLVFLFIEVLIRKQHGSCWFISKSCCFFAVLRPSPHLSWMNSQKQNVKKPKSHPVTPPSSDGLVDHFQFSNLSQLLVFCNKYFLFFNWNKRLLLWCKKSFLFLLLERLTQLITLM